MYGKDAYKYNEKMMKEQNISNEEQEKLLPVMKENYDGYTSTTNTISHRKIFQTAAKGIFNRNSKWTKPDGVVEVEVEFESYPAKLPSEYTPDNMKVTELFSNHFS